jgi:hypothetical protein
MNIQIIIVFAIIVAAIVYAALTLVRKRRSFSLKAGCSDDCGCNGGSKKLPS